MSARRCCRTYSTTITSDIHRGLIVPRQMHCFLNRLGAAYNFIVFGAMYNHYSTDSQYGMNSYGNYTSPSNYGISSSHSSSLPSGLSSYTPYADSLTGTSSNYLTSSSSFMNKPLRTGERHHFDDSYLTKSPSFMPHSDSFRPIGGNLDSLKKTTLTVDEAEDFSVRTRRVSHDLGKPSNMYASQFVSRSPAPGGLGFGGLTGLGGLSSMGRTVE